MQGERRWVRSLRPGDELNELYAVAQKELRQRRGGGPFLTLVLADNTGRISALVWENVGELDDVLQPGEIVQVQGSVQRYNQRLQVVIRGAKTVESDEVDESLFVRTARVDAGELWDQLLALIESVKDEHLKQLLFRVFSDSEVNELFKTAPAAQVMHHAYRVGLLEHTISVATSGAHLAEHYGLDRDLVVAGTLLHDLGKLWELEGSTSVSYTDEGRLLGHLTIGVCFVERVLADLPHFPAETRLQLLHMLLAHHGEYEYGSPRRPKTTEALLVHLVDNLDSRMAAALDSISMDHLSRSAWTPTCRMLERPIYKRPRTDSSDEESTS